MYSRCHFCESHFRCHVVVDSIPKNTKCIKCVCVFCANPEDAGNSGRKRWHPKLLILPLRARICTEHRRLQSNRICTLINGTNKTSNASKAHSTQCTHRSARTEESEQISYQTQNATIISTSSSSSSSSVYAIVVHNQQFSHINMVCAAIFFVCRRDASVSQHQSLHTKITSSAHRRSK